MNNFKPSKLPVDTIIAKIDTEERFIKRAPGLWDLLDVHCGDCGEVDTIIAKIDTEERFIKRAPGLWDLLDVHCGDCGEVVIESETAEDLAIARMHAYKAFGAADKYFGDNYKIVAVPFALLEIVAKHANDGYEDTNLVGIIHDYIEDLAQNELREAELAKDTELQDKIDSERAALLALRTSLQNSMRLRNL